MYMCIHTYTLCIHYTHGARLYTLSIIMHRSKRSRLSAQRVFPATALRRLNGGSNVARPKPFFLSVSSSFFLVAVVVTRCLRSMRRALRSISDATSNMVVTKRVSYKKVKTELARARLPPCVISPVISVCVVISEPITIDCCSRVVEENHEAIPPVRLV